MRKEPAYSFAAAARRVWDWLGPDANRDAVEAAERAADKLIRVKDLQRFWKATRKVPIPLRDARDHASMQTRPPRQPGRTPGCRSTGTARPPIWPPTTAPELSRGRDARVAAEVEGACALIHDILGNPFRPVVLDRAWLAGAVERLARCVYDERLLPSGELDPHRLAILADALEETRSTCRAGDSSLRHRPPRQRLLAGRSVPRPELSMRPGFRWSMG